MCRQQKVSRIVRCFNVVYEIQNLIIFKSLLFRIREEQRTNMSAPPPRMFQSTIISPCQHLIVFLHTTAHVTISKGTQENTFAGS